MPRCLKANDPNAGRIETPLVRLLVNENSRPNFYQHSQFQLALSLEKSKNSNITGKVASNNYVWHIKCFGRTQIMKPYLTIERFPYEEPYHVNLIMRAFNGSQAGMLEIYSSPEQINEIGKDLIDFPQSIGHVVLWELGSERPEDRFAHYLRFRAFALDSVGHTALHLRFCNNLALPDKAISEFCITTEAAALNRLGKLLCDFALLKHEYLFWSPTEGNLYLNRKEAHQDGATNLGPFGG
jgi:hypothetical protein